MKLHFLVPGALVAVVAVSGTTPRAATPQTTPAASEPKPLKDVAAAELEGSTFPRGALNDDQIGDGLRAETGTAERKCVDAGASPTAQSGDFIAGPFGMPNGSGFQTAWREGRTKLWWRPRHLGDYGPQAPRAPGLFVRSTRLDSPPDSPPQTATYRYTELVQNSGLFFNSAYFLPSAGRWMAVATFGANWGCFLINTH